MINGGKEINLGLTVGLMLSGKKEIDFSFIQLFEYILFFLLSQCIRINLLMQLTIKLNNIRTKLIYHSSTYVTELA